MDGSGGPCEHVRSVLILPACRTAKGAKRWLSCVSEETLKDLWLASMIHVPLLKCTLVLTTCRIEKHFFSDGRRFNPTHQNRRIGCILDTGCCRFHSGHILLWQHRPLVAFHHKDASLVRWLGGDAVIDRYLFPFHGEKPLRRGLSDSTGVQSVEEEQSDVPQGCHFGYLG